MTICPKCGGWKIAGPVYEQNEWGHEMLRYACLTCGYSRHKDTLDSRRRAAVAPPLTEPQP